MKKTIESHSTWKENYNKKIETINENKNCAAYWLARQYDQFMPLIDVLLSLAQ